MSRIVDSVHLFFSHFFLSLYVLFGSTIQWFHQVWYQGGVKSTVSCVFEDLKFKISEGSDPNWCFPGSAQLAISVQLRQLTGHSQENTNFGPNLMKFQIQGPQLLQKLQFSRHLDTKLGESPNVGFSKNCKKLSFIDAP